MADIFLSYSKSDRPRAKSIAEMLEGRGWSVWWDRVIPIGRTWDDIIEEEISKARSVVVLWSPSAVASDWVKNEARDAMERHIIIPATISPVRLPIEFRHIQTADLTSWTPGELTLEFELLLAALGDLLSAPQKAEPGAQSPQTSIAVEETSEPGTSSQNASIPQGSARRAGPKRLASMVGAESADKPKRKEKSSSDKKKRPRKAAAVSDKKPSGVTELFPGLTNEQVVKAIRRGRLLDKIQTLLTGFTDSHVFVGDSIPLDKARNATDSYAAGVDRLEALMLYDNTFFGGAKDGLLIATDCVYWHNLYEKPGKCPYAEITEIGAEEGILSATVKINECAVRIEATNHNQIAKALEKVIRFMKDDVVPGK